MWYLQIWARAAFITLNQDIHDAVRFETFKVCKKFISQLSVGNIQYGTKPNKNIFVFIFQTV